MSVLLEDVPGQLVGGGEGARLREGERLRDLLLDLRLDAGPLSYPQPGTYAENGVRLAPGRRLGLVAVAEVVILPRPDVLAEAVGHHLEEVRPPAGADGGDHLAGAGHQRRQVVAVQPLGRHPEGPRLAADIERALAAALVRVDGVAVVFADKKEGKTFESGEVQRLGEDALLGRAVAEEADDDRPASYSPLPR